jgi:hypothetical protein
LLEHELGVSLAAFVVVGKDDEFLTRERGPVRQGDSGPWADVVATRPGNLLTASATFSPSPTKIRLALTSEGN